MFKTVDVNKKDVVCPNCNKMVSEVISLGEKNDPEYNIRIICPYCDYTTPKVKINGRMKIAVPEGVFINELNTVDNTMFYVLKKIKTTI